MFFPKVVVKKTHMALEYDKEVIANHFITFFTNVATKLNEKIVKAKKPFSHYLGQTTDETIFLSPTTLAEVESLIYCIKSNKAIGPNSIPTKILKEFKKGEKM